MIKGGYAAGPQGKESGDITEKGWLYGAGMFLRREIYEDLKAAGFKNLLTGHSGKGLLSGEDAEICYAIVISGNRIWYDERLQFYHYTEIKRTNWDYTLKMFSGYGAANIVLTCYKLAIAKNLRLFNCWLWYYELLRLIKKWFFSFSILDRKSVV